MKKRMIVVLLALCIPLTLCTGCGSPKAVDSFFDTLGEIHDLKDYHLELTISSDEAGKNGLRIAGDVAKSNQQAHLTVIPHTEGQKEKGTLDVVVDGSDVYLKVDDWTKYVSERYAAMKVNQDANQTEAELLTGIAKDFGSGYMKITASENVFDLLSGSNQKEAVDAFSGWYQSLRSELNENVTEEDGIYTLSLTEQNLQTQQLALLKNLTDNEKTYRSALQPILKSVEDSITAAGWTDSDILDGFWTNYQERNTALEKQQKNGKWDEGSFTMTDADVGSDGAYQVSMTWTGEDSRYVQATITPTDQAAEISIPKDATNYSDQADQLANVYMDSKNLLHPQVGTSDMSSSDEKESKYDEETGEQSNMDWDKWFKENKDDTKDYSADLNLSSIKGYSHIKLTKMETEDGVIANLPVVTDYDYCDASFTDKGNANVLYLSSDSWEVDVYGLEADDRSMKDILTESIDSYITTYKDDWGYKITQKASDIQKNSDGSAYVAGFGYYDEDKDCEVTMVSLVTQMKGSSYVVDYELAFYSNEVQDDNCTAVKELCDYFGLDVPVTIVKK